MLVGYCYIGIGTNTKEALIHKRLFCYGILYSEQFQKRLTVSDFETTPNT